MWYLSNERDDIARDWLLTTSMLRVDLVIAVSRIGRGAAGPVEVSEVAGKQ